ncbi:unnamed protein product, partial [marine sediment metagenome]
HAKFHAANAAYQYYPEIKAENCSDPKKVTAACPKGIIGLNGKKPFIKDATKCDICRSCEEASEGSLKVESVPNKFIFNVESISGLDPAYIVGKAADILKEKGENLKKKLVKV